MTKTLYLTILGVGLSACSQFETSAQKFDRLCVDALKDRLKAPSTLKVASSKTIISKYMPENISEIKQRRLELESIEETRELTALEKIEFYRGISEVEAATYGQGLTYMSLITYDAENSYGAPLRDEATCEFVALNGELGEYDDASDMIINGQTNRERQSRQ